MNTRASAAAIRAAVHLAGLAKDNSTEMYEHIWDRMPEPDKSLLAQAAEAIVDHAHAHVSASGKPAPVPLGLGSALECLAKIVALMVEEGIPQ